MGGILWKGRRLSRVTRRLVEQLVSWPDRVLLCLELRAVPADDKTLLYGLSAYAACF